MSGYLPTAIPMTLPFPNSHACPYTSMAIQPYFSSSTFPNKLFKHSA